MKYVKWIYKIEITQNLKTISVPTYIQNYFEL